MSKNQKWKPPRPKEEGLKECLARAADQFGVGAGAILDMPEVQCTPRGALLEGCHGVLEYTNLSRILPELYAREGGKPLI